MAASTKKAPSGLGRGLAALIPTGPVAAPPPPPLPGTREIPVSAIEAQVRPMYERLREHRLRA